MTQSALSYRGATATLLRASEEEQSLQSAERRCVHLLQHGLRFVELRDDLLDDRAILRCAEQIPHDQTLLSLRRMRTDCEALIEQISPALLDIAWELGEISPSLTTRLRQSATLRVIRSCHTRAPQESVSALLNRLSTAIPESQLIKAALPIHNLHELWEGHLWHLQNPQRHLFLPISSDGSGRFRFYRLLLADTLLLNFLRDPNTPLIADQPSPEEWQTRQQVPVPSKRPIPFAAIVGDPVEQSRTPQHHGEFFAQRGMPVLKVRVTTDDIRLGDVLSILQGLGLRAAAVTSPLKLWLRESIDNKGGQWESAHPSDPQDAGNTLVIDSDGKPRGTSTDGVGLRKSWQQTLRTHHGLLGEHPSVAVFGGGGLLSLLRSVFPSALYLSARTGELRDQQNATPVQSPSVLIWSVGRSRYVQDPPAWLRPRLVFDLNYASDSPGRDFAKAVGAEYVDGSLFFEGQAAAQQAFWNRHLPVPFRNESRDLDI